MCALVARGGGKTTGGRARFILKMIRVPRAQCLFIATTRGQAESLMWVHLKDINDKMALGAKFNETKLTMRLKNKSVLRLVGADDKREIEKLRGQPFHEVGIDEAASHNPKLLENLMFRVIGPRLGDYDGVLWTIGTPGHILAGPFYDATRPGSDKSRKWEDREHPDYVGWVGWSFHAWDLTDGAPYIEPMRNLLREAKIQKEAEGWSDEHPIWRREYLGQWAADDTERVYKFRPHDEDGEPWNVWTPLEKTKANPFGLPPEHEWYFVYGIDMGHSDPFALQIFAGSETCPDLLQVYEFSKKGMHSRTISEKLHEMIEITGYPIGMVADTPGLGGAILDELREVYGLDVEPAERKHKHDAIELLNGDLIDGHIKVLAKSALREEWEHLQWAIDDFGKLKENKGQANNHSDAALYARRKAHHHFSREPEAQRPPHGSDELANLEAEESLQRLIKKSESDWLDDSADYSGFFE